MNDLTKVLATQRKMAELYSTATAVAGIHAIEGRMTQPIPSAVVTAALGIPRISDFFSVNVGEMAAVQGLASVVQRGLFPFSKDIHKAASITQSALGFEQTAMALMQTRKITSTLLGMNFAMPDLIPHFKAQAYVSSLFSLRNTLFKHPIQKEDSVWVDAVDRVTAETNEILDVTQQDGLQAVVEKLDEIKNVISTELGSIREQIAKPGTSKVDVANMFIGLLALLMAFLTYL